MKRILSLLFTFTFFFEYAQFNFYTGYIINGQGDTIQGEVKVNPKKELSVFTKIMFKDSKGMAKLYKSDKIKGFGYMHPDKKTIISFVSAGDKEHSEFYKVAIANYFVKIYEFQHEEMSMGNFYIQKDYFIYKDDEYVKLKSRKLKKQLSEFIQNDEALAELDKLDEIDIDKVSAILEKHVQKSSS